jgi:hypothetical protein
MFRAFVTGIFLVMMLTARAQQPEVDSAQYRATLKWLERKLTYNYYDNTNKHWWVNRFQIRLNGAINFKNIAASHPEKVMERVYHERTFHLRDINPRAITVSEVKEEQGRFAKGSLIRLEGFSDEKLVQQNRDGVRGTNVNFVHISLPEYLKDTVADYPAQVKIWLADAARLHARLVRAPKEDTNIKNAFRTLRGNFIEKDSVTLLNFTTINPTVATFTLKRDKEQWAGVVGYDATEKVFYITLASDGRHAHRRMKISMVERNLVLESSEGDRIFLEGLNTFHWKLGDWNMTFFRY